MRARPPAELAGLRAGPAVTTALPRMGCGERAVLAANASTGEFELLLDVSALAANKAEVRRARRMGGARQHGQPGSAPVWMGSRPARRWRAPLTPSLGCLRAARRLLAGCSPRRLLAGCLLAACWLLAGLHRSRRQNYRVGPKAGQLETANGDFQSKSWANLCEFSGQPCDFYLARDQAGLFFLASPRMEEAVYVGHNGTHALVDMTRSSQDNVTFQASHRWLSHYVPILI
jgi:hypothetical protein